jgi:hypothetical protein
MIPGSEQAKQLKKVGEMAKNPAESEQIQALVHIIAQLEHRQIERVEELHDALDIDAIERTKGQDEREEQLLGLVEALASGDLQGYWLEEVAGEHIENPDDAAPYLGLDQDAWEKQIKKWADQYRETAPDVAEKYSDRELAKSHVATKFGVSIDEFEREIVDWSGGEALESLLASNFRAVEGGIEAATAEITEEQA